MKLILIAAGAEELLTPTGHQTRLRCPNKQTISFSLVHPVLDEKYVDRICKRFGMSTSTFNRLYDETTDEIEARRSRLGA